MERKTHVAGRKIQFLMSTSGGRGPRSKGPSMGRDRRPAKAIRSKLNAPSCELNYKDPLHDFPYGGAFSLLDKTTKRQRRPRELDPYSA